MEWTVRQTICGLAELPALGGEGITHLVSILNPGDPEPELNLILQARLTLRFHDVIVPTMEMTAPEAADVDALLGFGRSLPSGTQAHLLVHCHMGISRSTAAMAALLAEAHPEAEEEAIFAQVLSIRPRAWPNSRVVALADEQLGRRGRLLEALARLYARQLAAYPDYAKGLLAGGRGAEVEMARG